MDVPGQLAFYFCGFQYYIGIARVEGAVALDGPGLDLEVLDAPDLDSWLLATRNPGGFFFGGGTAYDRSEYRN